MNLENKAYLKERRIKSNRFKYRYWKSGILMIIPAFIILIIFNTVPLGMALVRSFQDYSTKKFAGFQNFRLIFADPVFIKSFENVLLLGAVCLVLTIVISFFFAHLIIRLPKKFGNIIKILIHHHSSLGMYKVLIQLLLIRYMGCR